MAGTMNEPKNSRGYLQRINTVTGPAFFAFDTYTRIKNGESAPVAVGKALLTNLAWGLMPGGFVGGLALTAGMTAMQAAPAISRMISNAKGNLSAKDNMFGGNFVSTQAQQQLAMQGINQLNEARTQFVRQIANHARNAQKVY